MACASLTLHPAPQSTAVSMRKPKREMPAMRTSPCSASWPLEMKFVTFETRAAQLLHILLRWRMVGRTIPHPNWFRTMTLRRIISAMAVLGVLLHAGFVARHSGIMVAKQLDHQGLIEALTIICHSDGSTASLPIVDGGFPPTSEQASECPICSGLAPVAVLVSSPLNLPCSLISKCERIERIAERVQERLPAFWPPSRAPPSLA